MNISADHSPLIIHGYVRISRDDNRKQYSSIENQKRIICGYAREHGMTVQRIYEDDGVSGYSFRRPGFREMMGDLNSIHVIVAKDLSRIGRHNAKVLLFLEEMERLGKRVIFIDDGYDSLFSDDDIIGIRTWDNERHVKTTSRKVRRIKRMEQENGTLKSVPPFGYVRHPLNPEIVLIDQEAAAILNLEKDLYLEGNGIRRTAQILTERKIPTPTMIQKERHEALGLPYRREVATAWSYGMVKDTLFNDYHNGVLRTRKRERTAINGSDRRVPREQQYVFRDHHPKIFDDDTMKLLLDVKESRHRSRYRGQKRHVSLFSGCLYCRDCGRKLTAIHRPGRKACYVCGTYNKKGKQFCPSSHLIREENLTDALCAYLSHCLECLGDAADDLRAEIPAPFYSPRHRRKKLEEDLRRTRRELKLLLDRSVRELCGDPHTAEVLSRTWADLRREKAELILSMERELELLPEGSPEDGPSRESSRSPRQILEEIIRNRSLTRTDVEILVEQITVDRDGNARILLKCGMNT